jgi:hypothetical protein
MSQINLQEDKQYADFEIVLLEKQYCPIQKRLVPTGKKVSYCSNSGDDLWKFYEKHEEMQKAKAGKKGRKRNRKQDKK